MNRSGFLRRVVILILFAWCMHHFVLSSSQYIQDAQQREFLYWLMFVCIALAVVTMFTERLAGEPETTTRGGRDDDNRR